MAIFVYMLNFWRVDVGVLPHPVTVPGAFICSRRSKTNPSLAKRYLERRAQRLKVD